MNCIGKFKSYTVNSCGSVETDLVAASAGEYTFAFEWLNTSYEGKATVEANAQLSISGSWFNEYAAVVGQFFDPNGSVVEDTDGISEIHATIKPLVCL